MIYFEIRQRSGEIIASNIKKCLYYSSFRDNKNSILILKNRKLKSKYQEYDSFSVWLIADNEYDLLCSSKLFKKTIKIYASLSQDFLNYYLKKIRAHSHTLRSIQGKMKQKVDGLAAKRDFRGKNYHESKEKIANKIKSDIDRAADTICQLNKRISEIDAHIEGFDVLYMGDEKDVSIKEVNIKKVMLNILAPFLSDFKDKGVNINFFITDEYAENNRINLDYKLFNLAFCNFVDNAIKYSKPYSDISINFEKRADSFIIEIVMNSLRIDQDELNMIFDEGYSGRHATSDAGDGIGMAVIKKALKLTGMKIVIMPNYSNSEIMQGRKYIENHFRIENL